MGVRIGITGGIGSGKSGISGLLRVLGVPVYDCDREARRLMNEDAALREAITALAGADAYAPDGALNRRQLAAFMFGHADRVAAVNAIVHPAVRADFRRWAEERCDHEVVALESAILFEAGMRDDVDGVALVYTPLKERLQRAMARDGATEEQVRARMASQLRDEDKLPMADYIIRNAEQDAVTPQVVHMLSLLKGDLHDVRTLKNQATE